MTSPWACCSCPFDYVKIYDGYTGESPLIGTFCGRYNASTVLYSTDEALFLEFRTGQGRIEFGKPPIEQEADFSFERKGFNITYEFSDRFVNLGEWGSAKGPRPVRRGLRYIWGHQFHFLYCSVSVSMSLSVCLIVCQSACLLARLPGCLSSCLFV